MKSEYMLIQPCSQLTTDYRKLVTSIAAKKWFHFKKGYTFNVKKFENSFNLKKLIIYSYRETNNHIKMLYQKLGKDNLYQPRTQNYERKHTILRRTHHHI